MTIDDLTKAVGDLLRRSMDGLSVAERVATLNAVRRTVAEHSPFRADPVDLVEWVPAEDVVANDYNPNFVAPPEMELLRLSIAADGFTQPIVVMNAADARHEVVDGFHRHLVGKNDPVVSSRVMGYLPTVSIRADRRSEEDRIAATVRHNRARGKHAVGNMREIVDRLVDKGWSSEKIANELGMEADEVLRYRQVGGLSALFKDREFSSAWEPKEASDQT